MKDNAKSNVTSLLTATTSQYKVMSLQHSPQRQKYKRRKLVHSNNMFLIQAEKIKWKAVK